MKDKKWCSVDFYISSVLLAFCFELDRIDRKNGKLVEFVFNESQEKCEELISRYWKNELMVDPKVLVASINQLKTQMYAELRREE